MASRVVDLDDLLITWAWTNFLKSRGKEHSKIQFEDVRCEVVWERVRFVASPPTFSDQTTLDTPTSQIVFRSVYENKTGIEQEHTFQTERSTVSSCCTEVKSGYTRGTKLELKLGLPDDIASATVGFGRDVTMETSDVNTTETSVTWTINSNIKVPAKTRTVAELVVKEQKYTADFSLTTRMRGHVVVVITNLKDNNSYLTSIESDLCDVMKHTVAKPISDQFRLEGKTVIWEVKGSCDFRFGIEQHVQLEEGSLDVE